MKAGDLAQAVASGQIEPAEAVLTEGTPAEVALDALQRIRASLAEAQRIADFLDLEADRRGDALTRGLAARLRGHLQLMGGRPRRAIPLYRRARRLFSGHEGERHATAAGYLQALAYAGRYAESFEAAEEASAYFESCGDWLRAARIGANKANALHRMDRHQEAAAAYEQALAVLREQGAATDAAIVMRNYAACLMSLLDLDRADALYSQAREFFQEQGLSNLVQEIDLNRAYLLGRRGLVREALLAYRRVQESLESGSEAGFEIGHCLLDQADLMVEAGLWSDAERAAEKALSVFTGLGLALEEGKAALMAASAKQRLGRPDPALVARARKLLAKDKNTVWLAMARQLSAEHLDSQGRLPAALAELDRAAALLDKAQTKERRAELLLARIELASSRTAEWDAGAAAQLGDPSLLAPGQRARLLAAQSLCSGDWDRLALARRALQEYDAARSLPGAVLRQAARAALARVLDSAMEVLADPAERLDIARRMKNQVLAELVESPESAPADSRTRALRAQLHALQASAGLDGAQGPSREEAERRLEEAARELSLEAGGAQPGSLLPLKAPHGVCLVELVGHQGRLLALCWKAGQASQHDLGALDEHGRQARYLRLHIGRGLRGAEEGGAERVLEWFAAQFAPVLEGLDECAGLVMCPCPPLASVPLHALAWRGRPLHEQTEFSYAPSLDSWLNLSRRGPATGRGLAAAGFADAAAPAIARELEHVAGFGRADLLDAGQLDWAGLRTAAEACGWLHLAGHGIFREDRPLMSSLNLGAISLSAWDVGQLRLDCELATLSGCSTGVSAQGEALDSQGLIEAFLAAGARRVVASLWDVSDEASADLMARFSQLIAQGKSPHMALAAAAVEVRSARPHPAFWAGFWIFGSFSGTGCISWSAAAPEKGEAGT